MAIIHVIQSRKKRQKLTTHGAPGQAKDTKVNTQEQLQALSCKLQGKAKTFRRRWTQINADFETALQSKRGWL